jgi:threonine dehydratase
MPSAPRAVRLPTGADLDAALAVVQAHLPPSPLVPSLALGDDVWLKLETLQPSGAFKVRGALAALRALAADGISRVVTASAGNHALGVAWAAERLGVAATVVVAKTASPAKRAALARLPVELVVAGDSYDEAEAHALALAAERSAVYLSPYNDPSVIAGQATIGPELIAQLRERGTDAETPLTVVGGAGGGGFLSGLGLWAARQRPGRSVRVVGVEAEQSRAMSAGVAAGQVISVPIGETIADGLAGNLEPGTITVELVRRHVDTLVAVSEAELAGAMRWLASEHGLVVEGAGAASVAALLAGKVSGTAGATIAVLTGRNISLQTYAAVLQTNDAYCGHAP